MEELLPDPGHQAKSQSYLYREMELGHFEHPHDLVVLSYLWQFTWRGRNPEKRPAGYVMVGKTPVTRICASTGLSRRAVQRALARLRAGSWIETEQGFMESGQKASNDVFVRMDVSSHRERERNRALMLEVSAALDGLDAPDRRMGTRHTGASVCASQTRGYAPH